MATRTFRQQTASSGKYLWSNTDNWTEAADTPDDGDDVVIPAGLVCTFDNTDAYATGLASLLISGTLDAYTTAGAYVLKMAGNITGVGTFSAGTSGTAYPSNCSLTITFNGAFGFTTNLLYAVYCLEPTTKYLTLSADEAAGQTVLSIAGGVDVDADAVPWANGGVICINDALGGDTELNTFVSSTATEITVGTAIDSALTAGAVIGLVTRNITILGSGTTDVIAGWANGSYLRCSLRQAANSSDAISYSTNGTLTFDGVICPQSLTGTTGYAYSVITGGVTNNGLLIGVIRGFNSCSGFMNTGTVSANGNGFSSCFGFTNTGTVSANTYGFNSCYGFINSGTISANGYGFSACYSFTNTGTVSANTYGINSCSGVIYSTVFTGNTYDLRRSPNCLLFNCAMGSTTENYEYTLLVQHNYTESSDHDQSAGAFKAWTLGGVVTHQTASPPTGYAVYFRHTGESAVNYCFKQVPFAVEPGKTLSVQGVAKLSATLTSADDARLQIIDPFADPLVVGTNSPLATASVADRTDSTNWQTLACNWTNTGTLRRLVWVRTIMRHATAYVDFAHKESDLPDTGNVLVADTVNWVAGTFDEAARNTDPGVGNVVLATAYKILNVAKVGTLSGEGGGTGSAIAFLRKVQE
jgi:hypothetical protein